MECSICSQEIGLIDSKLNLYKCNHCSHKLSLPTEAQNEIYDESYFTVTHSKYFNNPPLDLYDNVINIIQKRKPNAKTIFDVGCGTGTFLKHSIQKNPNWKYFGIDLVSNKYENIVFWEGDFLEFNTNEKFDVITNFMVIEHVVNPKIFIDKIKMFLNPDGLLIVNTINSDSLVYRFAEFLKTFGFRKAYDRVYDAHHLQHFNNKSLLTFLNKNGFEIIENKVHNYNMKAVDVPKSSFIVEKLYLLIVKILFLISVPFSTGHHQTITCKVKK